MTTHNTGSTHPPRRPSSLRRRAILIPLVIATCFSAGSALTIWMIRDDLPAQIAVHWGANGRADGFTDLTGVIATGTALSLLLPLGMIGLGAALREEHRMSGIAAGLGSFIATLMALVVHAQRGSASTGETSPGLGLGVGAGVGIGIGLLTWLVTRTPRGEAVALTAPLHDETTQPKTGDRIAWTGRTTTGRMIWIVLPILLIPAGSMAVIFAAQGHWSAAVVALALAALGAVSTLAIHSRVIIDFRGIRVVGLGIVRWVSLPLSALEGATSTTAYPLGDFGGWGRRVSLDGTMDGFVTAEGPALRIARVEGKPLVITLRDAETAATALNTLIQRRAVASAPRETGM
jgi:hypothetical membrane protein